MNELPLLDDRKQAVLIARKWLEQNPVFLDTETTGLENFDEVVEVAVVDLSGKVLFESLIKPSMVSVSPAAQLVHKITDADLRGAFGFAEIWPALREVLKGRLVLIYNASYDLRLLRQTAEAAEMQEPVEIPDAGCVMSLYSKFYGDWVEWRGTYRWQKLIDAGRQCGLEAGRLHRAAGDADLARRVFIHMAECELEKDKA